MTMTSRRRKILRVVFALVLLLAGGVAALWYRFRPDEKGRVVPLFESIDMAAMPSFVGNVKAATGVTLFEGLPHPGWEQKIWETEKSTKTTFESHGHLFYSAPIALSAEDAAKIARLAMDESTFQEWIGAKMCGGYHPDWLIRWTLPDGSFCELEVCFGCHEAKVYGAKQLYCDLSEDSYSEFKTIFYRYRSQRPDEKTQ